MQTSKINISFNNEKLPISIQHRKTGKQTVLFIHGLGCVKESFGKIHEMPALKGFSLLNLDLVGYGDSAKSEKFSYSMDDQAEIVRLVLNELNINKVHIVSHSMGATVAVLLAEKIHDQVLSFIDVEGQFNNKDRGPISRTILANSLEGFIQEGHKSLTNKFEKSDKDGLRNWAKWSSKASPYALYQTSQEYVKCLSEKDILGKYKKLPVFKKFLFGAENKNIPMLQDLEHDEKIKIDNSGHFIMTDNPGMFNEVLSFCLA